MKHKKAVFYTGLFFDKAIAIKPDHASAWHNKGIALSLHQYFLSDIINFMDISLTILSILFLFMTGFLYLHRPNTGRNAPAAAARKESEKGHLAVTWSYIAIALLAISFTIAWMISKNLVRSPVIWGILVIGIYIAVVGLSIEAKRNTYGILLFFSGIFLAALIITGTILLTGDKPTLLLYILAGGSFLLFAVPLFFVLRNHYGKETLPNILRRRHKQSQIFEIKGVQFVFLETPESVRGGGSFNLVFELQNCWDQERRFSVKLKVKKSMFSKKTGQYFPKGDFFTFPRKMEVIIPGSTVGIFTIPVYPNPLLQGSFKFGVSAKVKGYGGKRVRRWRSQNFSTGISRWMFIAYIFVGLLAWGRGLGFIIDVLKRPTHQDIRPDEIPRCKWQVTWSLQSRDHADAVTSLSIAFCTSLFNDIPSIKDFFTAFL